MKTVIMLPPAATWLPMARITLGRNARSRAATITEAPRAIMASRAGGMSGVVDISKAIVSGVEPLARQRQRDPESAHRVADEHQRAAQGMSRPLVHEHGTHELHRVGERQPVGNDVHSWRQLLAREEDAGQEHHR